MDNSLTPEEGATPEALVAEAIELMTGWVQALNGIMKEIEDGKTERAREMPGHLTELRKAAGRCIEERRNVEKLQRGAAGGVSQSALDLNAARLEIGRRLARLRRAGDAG